MFDYRSYWKSRLKKAGSDLKGVGHKRFNNKANLLMYKKVEEELSKVIDENNIRLKDKTVLDAGAGIGMFTSFYQARGAKVTAVDISEEALSILNKNHHGVKTKVCDVDKLTKTFKNRFDIVHCFDVLYHIVDDNAFEKTVTGFTRLSKQYIIIHDIAPYWHNTLDRKHVRVDRKLEIQELFNQHGFELIGSYPTHILYVKNPFYFLVSYAPKIFFHVDRFLVKLLPKRGFETTRIRLYKKKVT